MTLTRIKADPYPQLVELHMTGESLRRIVRETAGDTPGIESLGSAAAMLDRFSPQVALAAYLTGTLEAFAAGDHDSAHWSLERALAVLRLSWDETVSAVGA